MSGSGSASACCSASVAVTATSAASIATSCSSSKSSPVSRAGSVLVGVRPEKVMILTERDPLPPGCNVLGPGTVVDVSFSGVSTQYQVMLPGLGTFGVFVQNLVGGATVAWGDTVRLAWQAGFTFGLDGGDDVSSGALELDGVA